MTASERVLLGFLKTTLIHRHAFIPSLSQMRAVGAASGVPGSFARELALCGRKELEREALAGILKLHGHRASPGAGFFDGLIERYAHEEGAEALARLARRRPLWWPSLVWLALARLRRCELAEAKAALDALALARPDWVWSYLLRSELGRVDIEFAPALRDLDRAAALEPDNAWTYALRARVLFQKGDHERGLRDLDRAILLDPRAGWMRAWRGDARRKRGDLKGALEDLLRAKGLEPAYDRTYLWLGKTFLSLELPERAVEALDEAVTRCAYFEKAYAERSRALRRLGRCEEALRDVSRAAAVNHRHDWLGSWTAEPYPLSAEQEAGLKSLAAFAAGRPRSGRARAWLGETLVQAGRVEEGLAHLDAALRLPGALAWAHAWRGEALVRLGRLEEAGAALDRAIALDEGYGRAFAWRGRVRFLQGRPAAAIADYDRSVKDSLVEYSWLYFWRAQARKALGTGDRGRSDFKTAAALEPGRREFQEALTRA